MPPKVQIAPIGHTEVDFGGGPLFFWACLKEF
jgi:hypothetical protein